MVVPPEYVLPPLRTKLPGPESTSPLVAVWLMLPLIASVALAETETFRPSARITGAVIA